MWYKKRTPQQQPTGPEEATLGAESMVSPGTAAELAASRPKTPDGEPRQEKQQTGIRGKPHYR